MFLLFSVAFMSCKKEETLTATNFTATVTTIADAQVVGNILAEGSSDELMTYTLTTQNVPGALIINGATGQLSIFSSDAIWSSYCTAIPVTTLTGTVIVTKGDLTTTCTISILLSIGGC